MIAACCRVHGDDFLPFVADYFRVEGTAQNLLGVIRRAEPRGATPDELPRLIGPDRADLDDEA